MTSLASPRWRFGSSAQLGYAALSIIISTLLLGLLAFAVIWPLLLHGQPFYAGTWREIASATLMLMACAALLWLLLVRVARTSLTQLGWSSLPTSRDIALGLVGFVLTQTIFICAFFGGSAPRYLQAVQHFSAGQRLEALICGLQAALFEESLYRGYLQPGLAARFGAGVAILVTAAVFSLKHFRFQPLPLALFFAYGVIWGLLRHRTHRLWAPGFAHFLNWAVNVFL